MSAQNVRLAIIATHPIQYQAPWFRMLAEHPRISPKVFYLFNPEHTQNFDQGFQQNVQWDLPLLEGYEYCFVENTSKHPGTHHRRGLKNPSLKSQLEFFQPDALLSLCYNYTSIYRLLFRDSVNVPILFRGDSHRLFIERGVFALLRRLFLAQVLKKFAACLYVGSANKNYFLEHGVDERRLFFCPHAIDSRRFQLSEQERSVARQRLRRQLEIPEDSSVILFAGKFEQKKRPLDLIQAFRELHTSKSYLLLVGAGKLEKQIAQQQGDDTRIKILPFQNQSRMPAIYGASDFLVLPSSGKSETWGLAVNEAMSVGLPIVVSSQVGCAQDLVRDGENGFIFEAENIADLREKLSRMLDLQESWAEMSRASKSIIKEYSYDTMTGGLLEALEFCLR